MKLTVDGHALLGRLVIIAGTIAIGSALALAQATAQSSSQDTASQQNYPKDAQDQPATNQKDQKEKVKASVATDATPSWLEKITMPAVLGSRDNFVHFRPQYDRAETQNDESSESDFNSIPWHATQLEHDCRMAEQQRIEVELRRLQEEVRQLREILEQKK